ncbi:MAG: DNA/RNA nuclease SfsA [Parvibaculum sp.]
MQFPDPLIPGRLLRRYKRFLSDIRLEDGREVVAHCANPGSMMGLAEPGAAVWLSPSRNPARKLKYSWELVAADGALVGIHTGRANALVAEALEAAKVPELDGYGQRRPEVRYGTNSRIDFLLEAPGKADIPPCYLEVKSVTLKRGRALAEFPDAVTVRGAKHLAELSEVARQGSRAVLFFLVQRGDCTAVAPAADIDPTYAAALSEAVAQGVEVLCYGCRLSPAEITLDARLPLAL